MSNVGKSKVDSFFSIKNSIVFDYALDDQQLVRTERPGLFDEDSFFVGSCTENCFGVL